MRPHRAAEAPVLETGRLLLRPLSADDAEALCQISNEPAVRRYLWDDEPVSRARIDEVIEGSAGGFSGDGVGLFGVRLRDGGDLLGFCGFVRLGSIDETELGYELASRVWGRGIATEAARACLRYAFEEVGMERVIAGADPPNAASLRVLEKLGMEPLGNANPNAPDEPRYALYRKDFVPQDSPG